MFFYLFIILPTIVQSISILGPRILRPHSPYRVALCPGSKAATMFVAVEGRKGNGELFSQGREIQLLPGVSKILDIDIEDPGPGVYSLSARSTSGVQFASSAPLIYQKRSFAVFVQTDKRVYKQGDTIYFRVIALDKYLLPIEGVVDISLLDSNDSPVRQWVTTPLDRGVIAAEVVLADEPTLGEWTIEVDVRGQLYKRKILVADYVMPKFNLHVELPKEVLFSDGKFFANVTARHFNGKPVKGELTLAAFPVFFSDVIQPVVSPPTRKVINISGTATVVFDIQKDLKLAEDTARPIIVEAILEEEATLRRQNTSTRTLLVRTPYRLKVQAAKYFKPNLPYKVQLEVVNNSEEPLDEDGIVTVERLWDDGAPPNVTTVKLNNGLGVYTFIPDVAHVNSTLNILVRYKEITERVPNIQGSWSSENEYLAIEVLNRNVEVGGELRARIITTEPIDFVYYLVIGRGDILFAKTVEVSPPAKDVDLRMRVTAFMAPGCILIAWYPRLDTTVMSSSIYIPVGKLLQNKVEVSVSPPTGTPQASVEFGISAPYGSHAGLLGTDVRTLQAGLADVNGLGSGLTMVLIEREVESFSGLSHSLFKVDQRQPGLGTQIGEGSPADAFQESGVVILTESFITGRYNDSRKAPPIPPPETGTRPPLAGPYAFSRIPPPTAPRYYLSTVPADTWFLANFSIGPDETSYISRSSPPTINEWNIGAFAIHPIHGLGLATPKQFKASTTLSLRVETPEVMQKGEMLAAVVVVSSSLTVDTTVEVTFHNSELYFEFEPLENELEPVKKIDLFRRQNVLVPAKGSASTAFLISMSKTGEAPIIIDATGNGISAKLFNSIHVKDGQQEKVSSWSLLDARDSTARTNLSINNAAGVTPGTRLGGILFKVAGDILAPALLALKESAKESLVPAASPPQAIQPLALSTILLDHLQAIQKDEIGITAEPRTLAIAGYQRVLAYRLPDHSFAADINSKEGDIYCTAVVARWLGRGGAWVPTSGSVGGAAASWLARAQQADGSWPAPPPSRALNPLLQRPLPLTAYVTIALIESQGGEVLYRNVINKASEYIGRRVAESEGEGDREDAFTLALASCALALVKHPAHEGALRLLDRHANNTDGMRWWSRALKGNEHRNPWLRGNTVEAETAAWGLRALLGARQLPAAAAVAKYLLASYDPTTVTADQVDALAALAAAAGRQGGTRLAVTVAPSSGRDAKQFNIDDDDALILKSYMLGSSEGRNVSVRAEGAGLGVAGLEARATTNVTAPWPRYTLDPRVDNVSTPHRLQLSVCTAFVPSGNETLSGLTMLTVQLPSGYIADLDTLTALEAASHVVGARLVSGGGGVAAWLAPQDRRERCATLHAARALPVARQRPGYATLIDLYDSSHRARVFFRAKEATSCQICSQWESCNKVCGRAGAQTAADRDDRDDQSPTKGHAVTLKPIVILLICALALH